ncbi:MAG: DUF6538 domain-containing protein [Alphaproteobacteria bacterium]
MAKKSNHYIKRRSERWYYCRRVPNKYAAVDPRGTIRISLNTDSVMVAREKRDRLAEADEALWQTSLAGIHGFDIDINAMQQRHKHAQNRALALGFSFKPIDELLASENVIDLVERVEKVAQADNPVSDAKVLLGTIEIPKVTIREALELYLTTLSIGERKGKSPDQLRKWRLPKQRAIEHFVALCGNLSMDEIERCHARQFYEWWGVRLSPTDSSKGMKPNSANRDLGNLRKLYRSYWTYQGQEDRRNPFRELRFSDSDSDPTPAFSDEWVRSKTLAPEALSGLHPQAQLIVMALIETGCRPSEIANLEPQDIHLDVDVPYISICAKENRELKTKSSKRKIPLVGVSLAAMKRAPNGFPHYKDRGYLLSSSLMKAFKARGLFELEGQRIYSFRHAFEKRMLEAGLDYGDLRP